MSIPPPQNQHPNYNHAPSDTQAISIGSNYPATGAIYPPGQHPRVKSLLSLTLISLGLTVLVRVLEMFATDSANNPLVDASTEVTETSARASISFAPIIGILIMAGLYILVYSLIKSGKNSGRITGIVFCIIGTLGSLFGVLSIMLYTMPMGLIISVLYVAIVIVNIFWLVRAFHSDVKANLV